VESLVGHPRSAAEREATRFASCTGVEYDPGHGNVARPVQLFREGRAIARLIG
jgi:hypothetical protein